MRSENGAMLDNHPIERVHLLIKVTELPKLFPEISRTISKEREGQEWGRKKCVGRKGGRTDWEEGRQHNKTVDIFGNTIQKPV